LVILAALQNTRVLLAATILGVFTFGVVGMVLIMIPFAIYGFIMGQVVMSGLSPLPFIMAILPHGVIEIPAILIAGAAALRLGSIVTRPPKELTVGEAWLRALGDAIKIGIGVVLPLLVIAAMLEVWVTPQVVQFVLTH
jgi:stage II sporulation protein M